jgi:hypothetical protein
MRTKRQYVAVGTSTDGRAATGGRCRISQCGSEEGSTMATVACQERSDSCQAPIGRGYSARTRRRSAASVRPQKPTRSARWCAFSLDVESMRASVRAVLRSRIGHATKRNKKARPPAARCSAGIHGRAFVTQLTRAHILRCGSVGARRAREHQQQPAITAVVRSPASS